MKRVGQTVWHFILVGYIRLKWGVRLFLSLVKRKMESAPVAASLVSAALLVCALFGLFSMVSCQGTLPPDASFCGYSLAGMDQKQVDRLITETINPMMSQKKAVFTFHGGAYEIDPARFSFHYDAKKVFRAAKGFSFGQEKPLRVEMEYQKADYQTYLADLKEQIQIRAQTYQYQIQGQDLIVSAGAPGVTFDTGELGSAILEQIATLSYQTVAANEQPLIEDCMNINIDEIYQKVRQDEKDAGYSIDSLGVLSYSPEQIGIDFSLEQAKSIITDPTQGTYAIPLWIVGPKVTVEKLRYQHDTVACPNTLSSYTTTFGEKDQGRNYNIQKAASFINGTVLYPGERFSFHDVVGKTGAAQGYQESTVYTPDGLDTGFGGGVCQVCTTTYVAAMYSNMEILERHNHSYTVDYIPLGMDAATSDSGPDLKFKNNRSKPVRLLASVTKNSITITIDGTSLPEEDCVVSLEPQVMETYGYQTVQRTNPQLPAGRKTVAQEGQNGYKVDTIKTVSRHGVVISSDHIYSRYKPMDQIVEIGTRKASRTDLIFSANGQPDREPIPNKPR